MCCHCELSFCNHSENTNTTPSPFWWVRIRCGHSQWNLRGKGLRFGCVCSYTYLPYCPFHLNQLKNDPQRNHENTEKPEEPAQCVGPGRVDVGLVELERLVDRHRKDEGTLEGGGSTRFHQISPHCWLYFWMAAIKRTLETKQFNLHTFLFGCKHKISKWHVMDHWSEACWLQGFWPWLKFSWWFVTCVLFFR